MALLVWLPLNGNIKNLGVTDVSSSGTPKYLTSAFGTGLDISQQVTFSNLPTLSKFSTCFWVKVTDCTSDWADSVSFNSVQADGSSASWFRYEATKTSRACSFHNNSPYAITQGSRILIQNKGEWHHIAAVYDGATIKHYVDGVLFGSDAGLGGSILSIFRLGETGHIAGVMNDFRIYDNCLSLKEIKELSKGLVTHFPFNCPGNNNLLIGTCGEVLENSGAVNQIQSKSFTLTSGLDAASLSGSQITVSVDVDIKDAISSTDYSRHRVGAEISMVGSAGTTWVGAWTDISQTTTKNLRTRLKSTGTIPAGWTGTFGERNMYIQGIASGDARLSNMKVELGNQISGWGPNQSEMGMQDQEARDVSGFGYHGQKTGAINWSSDTPRYSGSGRFTTGAIQNIPSAITANTDEFTIAIWFKPYNTNTMAIYNNRSEVEEGVSLFWINGAIRFDTGASYQWTLSTKKPEVNKWNHIVVTFSKKSNLKKYYLNGTLISTTNEIGTLAKVGAKSSIGQSSSGGVTSSGNQLSGQLSDFRIYSKELSDEDVKQLYKTSGVLDSKGNMLIREMVEE